VTRTLLPAASLARREVVRFLRQRNRVVSALLQPALFWALFGAGFSRAFAAAPGGDAAAPQDFLRFLFPGTVVLVVLFTAIFATFSVLEDRAAGFLQSVLAAPVSRTGIVLGKVAGGTAIALVHGALFLLLALAPGVDVPLSLPTALAALGALALVGVALGSLGLAVAWPMESVQGFHAVMMLFLLPMWLLSGAFFSFEGSAPWLGAVMHANPLSYGVALVRHALDPDGAARSGGPGPAASLAVAAGFAAVTFLAALFVVGRRGRRD